jgi:hypothetical protein
VLSGFFYGFDSAEKQLPLAGIEPPTFGVPAGETSIRPPQHLFLLAETCTDSCDNVNYT